jgi:hypothetical protein
VPPPRDLRQDFRRAALVLVTEKAKSTGRHEDGKMVSWIFFSAILSFLPSRLPVNSLFLPFADEN